MRKLYYSVLIQWSDEDQCYIASLPEFPNHRTHGDTYEEAAKAAQEVLEDLVIDWRERDQPLPQPQTFVWTWQNEPTTQPEEART